MSMTVGLTDGELRKLAPSIFATKPSRYMSESFSFIPTIRVINKMRDEGFVPVTAGQARTNSTGRTDDRVMEKRHVVRFRRVHELGGLRSRNVGDEIPEIILKNAHDGSSSYAVWAGLFRLVCSNGLVVASADFGSYVIRHDRDEVKNIIDASFEIVKDVPKIMAQVDRLKAISYTPREQILFAEKALELREVTLRIEPRELLIARRPQDGDADKKRSAWQTFNVIQEHLTKGGVNGITSTGRGRRLAAIRNPVQDVDFNRALWTLATELKSK